MSGYPPRFKFIGLLVLASGGLHAEDDVIESQRQAIPRNIQQQEVASNPTLIQFQRRAIIPQHATERVTTSIVTPKAPLSAMEDNRQPLTRHEKLLLSKSQRYFENNWNESTGLFDSVQGYPHATMWDIASGIAGLLALEALSINNQQVTNFRLEKMLNTLFTLPLYKGLLPNRQYNTQTALPSGNMSQSRFNGNGWSALDLGRLYIWLTILKQQKPQLAAKITAIQNKWRLVKATKNGNLYGTKLTSTKEHVRQEGRLGYLQYAAKGYQLIGLNVDQAYNCDKLQTTQLYDIPLLIDKGNLPFFTLDPYLLYAIEIGDSEACWNQIEAAYRVHQLKFSTSNKLTAYAEDSLNRSPWFAYNNISYQGHDWHSVSHSGHPINNGQTFSNKAAFAMSVLFDSHYSQQLAKQVISNSARHAVIPTGLYGDGRVNTAYNINTNSLILVSLWYKSRHRKAILKAQ